MISKKWFLILSVIILSLFSWALFFSSYTLEENSSVISSDIKRSNKKAINRIKERFCMKSDLECSKQKLRHRVEETTDASVDKIEEMKDRVD